LMQDCIAGSIAVGFFTRPPSHQVDWVLAANPLISPPGYDTYNEGCLANRSTHDSEQNQYVLLLK
jgi:hypothetical protein